MSSHEPRTCKCGVVIHNHLDSNAKAYTVCSRCQQKQDGYVLVEEKKEEKQND